MRIQLTTNTWLHFFPKITLTPEQLRASRRRTAWILGIKTVIDALACAVFSFKGNEVPQYYFGLLTVLSAIGCVAAAWRARA